MAFFVFCLVVSSIFFFCRYVYFAARAFKPKKGVGIECFGRVYKNADRAILDPFFSKQILYSRLEDASDDRGTLSKLKSARLSLKLSILCGLIVNLIIIFRILLTALRL